MSQRKGESREDYLIRQRLDQKVRYAKNPEKYRKIARNIRKNNRESGDIAYRKYHLKSKYGITEEDFDALVLSQNGVCAICKGEPVGAGSRLHVDHDHKTQNIRGLLCSKCNTALGLMNDDIERLTTAIIYLKCSKIDLTRKGKGLLTKEDVRNTFY